jgi:hypothetical protein
MRQRRCGGRRSSGDSVALMNALYQKLSMSICGGRDGAATYMAFCSSGDVFRFSSFDGFGFRAIITANFRQ